jgi:glutathione peroxidase
MANQGEIEMSIHTLQVKRSDGNKINLEEYRGKVLLIVNTASKCGLTPQYEGIEKLFQIYKEEGLTVLGFPCNQFGGQEPGTDEEISAFCSLNYNVTFPLFQKIEVNGENAHPLYRYLRKQAPEDSNLDENQRLYQYLRAKYPEFMEGSSIKWNFTKFLIDQEGNVVKRYAPTTQPEEMIEDIEKLLSK